MSKQNVFYFLLSKQNLFYFLLLNIILTLVSNSLKRHWNYFEYGAWNGVLWKNLASLTVWINLLSQSVFLYCMFSQPGKSPWCLFSVPLSACHEAYVVGDWLHLRLTAALLFQFSVTKEDSFHLAKKFCSNVFGHLPLELNHYKFWGSVCLKSVFWFPNRLLCQLLWR